MAAAIKNFVGEIAFYDQPDSSEGDAGYYREHTNDAGADDGSDDHGADGRLLELEGGLVPGNLLG